MEGLEVLGWGEKIGFGGLHPGPKGEVMTHPRSL